VYGFYRKMQEELGALVTDAVLAPFKYAEFLAGLAGSFGWHPSRMWGSEPPPEEEIADWGIFNQPPKGASRDSPLPKGIDVPFERLYGQPTDVPCTYKS
jgi:hypothetical protein